MSQASRDAGRPPMAVSRAGWKRQGRGGHVRLHGLVVVGCFMLMSTACGSQDPPSTATPTATVTVTETQTMTSSPSVPPAASDEPEAEGDGPAPTATGLDDPTASPSVPTSLSTDRRMQPLGLADAQAAVGEWQESRYEVADRVDVRGVGVPVDACGDSTDTPLLEFRLANRFATLRFSASQANNSVDSNQLLTVLVEGNGSQLDIQKVPFNRVKSIEVSVDGVNALRIRLFLDENECNYQESVVGVLESLVVT